MALYDELLDQADHLLSGQRSHDGIACDADVRRAISNAYYAVFHFLVIEATDLLCPPGMPGLAARFRRAFLHGSMKTVCENAVSRNAGGVLKTLFAIPLEPALVSMAQAFVILQTDRHLADYDTGSPISTGAMETSVTTARRAISGWQDIRNTHNARVFLTALPMHGNWQKN